MVIRGNVLKEAALAELEPGGLFRWLSEPLRKLAYVHILFRLFRVKVTNAERSETKLFAIDAVNGTLDLVVFETFPDMQEEVPSNLIPAKASVEESAKTVEEHVRRMVFKKGFFKVKDLKIEAKLAAEFGYPYWVGLYGRGEQASLVVLDAVRRRREGAKVREIIREWFMENQG